MRQNFYFGFQDMAYIKAYHSPKTLLTSVTIKESLSIHFENIKKPLVSKFLGGIKRAQWREIFQGVSVTKFTFDQQEADYTFPSRELF